MPVLMLRYRGDGAYRPGLPARDIDRAELDAIAAGRKVDVGEVVEEATGSGLYLAVHDTPDVPRETPAPVSGLAHYAELKVRAKELGLPAVGKAEILEDAIATEEARLAEEAARSGQASGSGEREALLAVLAERTDDELAAMAAEAGVAGGQSREATIAALVAATEGAATPGDDPGAVASGEPGMRPEVAHG